MGFSFSLLRLALRNPTSRSLPPKPPPRIKSSFFSSLLSEWVVVGVLELRSASQPWAPQQPSERVSAIVDDISGLTLLELADLTEALRSRLGVEQMPVMAVMMPGMASAASRGLAAWAGAAKEAEEKKEEKTAFDLKLESFDAASKIKIIKEVRTFTDLGLKEAKELVEKAPTVLKTGVLKEEAEKIVEKMKEIGAKVFME
ncbi:LOW QUALITY PROTEIN: 50S ribosomal protein L7/L12 [Phoenix dactylifera]|uniref:LOW QUALITY PROTEIN: 50S ribosomal protein L7/L12 n=1 Tax=Phoenix dactylifera TaxID=42345 RepID=A0A8B7BJX3_PHODC|nr:LOW QUALITY PROTEIN: 50S ribosomal protein L7/L12 [Phoenix dactylifera]